MCDIGKAISRIFTPPGTGALEAQETQAVQQAQSAENAATTALTTAITDTTQASLPVLDNPSALAASQAQNRKLLDQQGAAWAFGNAPTVAPTVATRALSGA